MGSTLECAGVWLTLPLGTTSTLAVRQQVRPVPTQSHTCTCIGTLCVLQSILGDITGVVADLQGWGCSRIDGSQVVRWCLLHGQVRVTRTA